MVTTSHLPLIGLFLFCIFILLYKFSNRHNYPILTNLQQILFYVIITSTVIFAINEQSINGYVYNHFFVKSSTSDFYYIFVGLVFLVSYPVLFYYHKKKNIENFEFIMLSLIAYWCGGLLIDCQNFFAFYLILETQSLCLYVIAGYFRTKINSIMSSIKYFVMSSFMSIIFLMGCSILYAHSNSFEYSTISISLLQTDGEKNTYFILSFILISATFLFKLYSVPFHFTIAEIYANTSLSSISALSIIPTIPLVASYSNYISIFNINPNLKEFVCSFLIFVGVATSIVGCINLAYQNNIQKALAYSTITNVGPVIILMSYSDVLSSSTMFYYLVFYTLSTVSLVMLLLLIKTAKPSKFKYISDFTGLYSKHPVLSVLLGLLLFSTSGMPPFLFFFGKLIAIESLFMNGCYIGVFGVLFSTLVSMFFYLRIIKEIYYKKQNSNLSFYFFQPSIWINFTIFLSFFFQLWVFFFYFGIL